MTDEILKPAAEESAYIKSPNGTIWKVTVDDEGVVTTEAVV